MQLEFHQIDAFTDRPFRGNPAVVYRLDAWLEDELMQRIAAEHNQAETAFTVREGSGWRIRWFTPACEVPLCGHATLATAHALFELYGEPGERLEFSCMSGALAVAREAGRLVLDFPAMGLEPADLLQGVFAGGDMVPSERTVTVAIGHGKKAARYIDAYLRGGQYAAPDKHPVATLGRMNTWYYADAPKQVRQRIEGARRSSTFDEVVQGLDEESAVFEARRCMSCGNCFGCDNCFGVCPDNAITKLKPGEYEFKYDYCKGCGLCAEECPCGAISMIPEEV